MDESFQVSKWFNYYQHIIGILVISFVSYYIVAKLLFRKQKCIQGKVALVTGGGSGLGAAIALQLAKKGCNIAILDINYDAAKKTALTMRSWGVKAQAYRVDVSSLKEIEGAKRQIELDLGKVDIVVNNAAILFQRSLET